MQKAKRKNAWKRIAALFLAGVMLCSDGVGTGVWADFGAETVQAATTVITSMEYYDGTKEKSVEGAVSASAGFVMPKFNKKTSQEIDLDDVLNDLQVQVRQQKGTGNRWKNVEDVFKYGSEWAWEHQADWDGWVFWFKVKETTDIRFHAKTNNVNLDYRINFTQRGEALKSIAPEPSGEKLASVTGESGIDKDADWIFNNDPTLDFEEVTDELEILVKREGENNFVPLLDNPDSGWIYDKNFGVYTDGSGGWWFNTKETFTVRLRSKRNTNIYADKKIIYKEYDNYTLTPYPNTDTTLTADKNGALGICLPQICGTNATGSTAAMFTYEVCVGATYNKNTGRWSGGNWKNISDVSEWQYQGSGYNQFSSKFQWGYWVDTIYGLWFQPVINDVYFRVGFPKNGKSGGAIDGNYVYYTLIGNPGVQLPSNDDMGDIQVDNSSNEPKGDTSDDSVVQATPEGWNLIWHDEFNGNSVNRDNWTNQTGYFLKENDVNTWGWGNNELEWYSDSEKNTSVSDGKLKLTLLKEKKTFTAPNGAMDALYSSGKLISRNKFSVKYGRVDFRAKLPDGVGVWPALWMMPNDDVYGEWASSGEIDVMEGVGRMPELAYGTLHYGSTWPGNHHTGSTLNMAQEGNKKSDMTNWHVYSVIWEEGKIRIYADGKCYFKCTSDIWFSGGANGNKNAPFDQRFYLILNLAAGGNFDSGRIPNYDTFTSEEMYVDYVRVYQRTPANGEDEKNDNQEFAVTNGFNDGLYGDYKLGTRSATVNVENVTLSSREVKLKEGETATLNATVSPNNATNKAVTWKSENPDIATVENGIIKAEKAGTTNIIATAGGKSVTCKVTVTAKPAETVDVESVTLNTQVLSMEEGESSLLTATVAPLNATNKEVTWKSENSEVATVENGIVRAKKAGVTKIVATSGNVSTTCTVTVTANVEDTVKVSGVTLEQEVVELHIGEVSQLTAVVAPTNATNQNVTWKSSNDSIVSVDANGKITAKATGAVYIQVTTEDGGYWATTSVIVEDSQSEEKTYRVTFDSAGGTPVSPQMIKEGEAAERPTIPTRDGYVFKDWYLNGEVYTFGIPVNEDINLTALWKEKTDDGQKPGDGTGDDQKPGDGTGDDQKPGDGTGDDQKPGDGTGDDQKPGDGTGDDQKPGDGTTDGKTSCLVTFNSNGGSQVASQTVEIGQLAARPVDPTRDGYVFKGWYVGNEAYNFNITVDCDIMLTAVWEPATVTPENIKVTSIEVSGVSKKVAAGKKIKLTAKVMPENAIDRTVTWRSSNEKFATVTSSGEVTLKKAGKKKRVTITATANDGSGIVATYKIKIMSKAVKKITLKASTTKVKAGSTVKINATVIPKTSSKNINKKLKWVSDKPQYATVNAKGVVKTKKAGKNKKVKITAMSTDGSNKVKSITIRIM